MEGGRTGERYVFGVVMAEEGTKCGVVSGTYVGVVELAARAWGEGVKITGNGLGESDMVAE